MNGGIYSTGNEIVDENAKLNISGNIIPQVWYRTIIRESGKPNLTAIIILADIVYWYKPTEIRDEGTGQVIGVRKKFKSDLLQRSYQQISEQFGISKKEATNAVVFLEKLGVVKRVFRTISMNGIVVNNVLYLELIVDRLKKLTYLSLSKGRGCHHSKREHTPTGKQSPGYPKRYLRLIAGRQIQRLLQRLQQKVPKRIQQK